MIPKVASSHLMNLKIKHGGMQYAEKYRFPGQAR